VPLNYFQILADFEADNPPANGEKKPCDLIVFAVPVDEIEEALKTDQVIEPQESLNHVVWVKSSATNNPVKGGEALILEATDGQIKYVPIRHLNQDERGQFTFSLDASVDPLGLLHDRNLRVPSNTNRRDWLITFHLYEEWLKALCETEYAIAMLNLVDVSGVHVDRFLSSEEFQRMLAHFSSEELKQKYIAGVRRKFRFNMADLRVWPNPLWNFNSKGQTAGGSHGGITPDVTRVTAMFWGGQRTGIGRGRVVSEAHTTLDFAPTLLKALGMLSPDQRVIRANGAFVERPFHPFPGRLIDLWPDHQEEYTHR
jgi:hypothetical protein